jgi:hypothetical protein
VPLSDEENRLLAQMEQALGRGGPIDSWPPCAVARMERAAKVRAGGAVLCVRSSVWSMLLGGCHDATDLARHSSDSW